MTWDETIDYLKYLIIQEHTELGLPGKRPQYFKEAWKPVNCWLNDGWNWSDVPHTLENIKAAEYPGPGRLVDFYKDCIKKRLLS